MADVRILAGLLTASREDRTVTGLLLPYGEIGNTNLGKFAVDSGAFAIPADPMVVGLDVEHDREQPVGRAVAVAETDEGIVATFAIARTPEGDETLDLIESGERRSLSAEVADVVIRSGRAIAGRLFGAAVCAAGAFPSAALYASDVGDLPAAAGDETQEEAVVADAKETTATLDAEAVTYTSDVQAVDVIDDGDTVTTVTTSAHVEETYESAPADTQTDSADAEEETDPDAADASETTEEEATVPETLNATVPAGSMAARVTQSKTLLAKAPRAKVFAHLADAYRVGGKGALYAALSDVVPADLAGIGAPDYLGELWSGRAYQSKVVDLLTPGNLRARKMTGWRWVTKPVVAAYSGNKSAVPSAAIETEEVEISAARLAVGHDIDRIHADFGETEFFEAYFRAITESYARVLDTAVFTAIETAAGAATPVGDVPTGVATGWAMVVDGALAVNDIGPATFGLVAPDLWRDMLLTRNDDALAMLSAAVGVEEGQVLNFKLRAYSGLNAGQVLVGVRDAVTVHQPAGASPIRVDALDLVNGGVDKAAFGYYAVNVHAEDGLALIDDGES